MAVSQTVFAGHRRHVRKGCAVAAVSLAFVGGKRLATGFIAPTTQVAPYPTPVAQAALPRATRPGAPTPWAPAALACAAVGAAFKRRALATQRRGGRIEDAEGDGDIEDLVPFELRGFSLASVFVGLGSVLLFLCLYDYAATGVGGGGTGIGAIGLIYALPILLLGWALAYAEIQPVEIEVAPGAEGLFEAKATPTLRKVKQDVTRHRYGDNSHLEPAIKTLGLVVPQGRYPQLQKVIEAKTETGELECTFIFESKDVPYTTWSDPAKVKTMDRFFGPGIWSMVYKYDGAKKLAAMKLTTGKRPEEDIKAKGKTDAAVVASLISSKKSVCVHPDREDPYLCGDCPRN